jgi:hypothetical protein
VLLSPSAPAILNPNKTQCFRTSGTTKVQNTSGFPSVFIRTSKAADLAPGSTTPVDQIGSVARSQQLLFLESQKSPVVDDAVAGIDATHEIREERIVYFECVTENCASRVVD